MSRSELITRHHVESGLLLHIIDIILCNIHAKHFNLKLISLIESYHRFEIFLRKRSKCFLITFLPHWLIMNFWCQSNDKISKRSVMRPLKAIWGWFQSRWTRKFWLNFISSCNFHHRWETKESCRRTSIQDTTPRINLVMIFICTSFGV